MVRFSAFACACMLAACAAGDPNSNFKSGPVLTLNQETLVQAAAIPQVKPETEGPDLVVSEVRTLSAMEFPRGGRIVLPVDFYTPLRDEDYTPELLDDELRVEIRLAVDTIAPVILEMWMGDNCPKVHLQDMMFDSDSREAKLYFAIDRVGFGDPHMFFTVDPWTAMDGVSVGIQVGAHVVVMEDDLPTAWYPARVEGTPMDRPAVP